MKKVIPLIAILCALTAILLFSVSRGNQIAKNANLIGGPIDKGGLFVGEKKKPFVSSGEYAKQVKAVDDAWDSIELGNSHVKSMRYVEAAEAYEKAYSIGGMTKVFSGFKLANTYEKLGRLEDAISLINEMMKNLNLNEASLQDAQAMKARLLAAKQSQSQSLSASEKGTSP